MCLCLVFFKEHYLEHSVYLCNQTSHVLAYRNSFVIAKSFHKAVWSVTPHFYILLDWIIEGLCLFLSLDLNAWMISLMCHLPKTPASILLLIRKARVILYLGPLDYLVYIWHCARHWWTEDNKQSSCSQITQCPIWQIIDFIL